MQGPLHVPLPLGVCFHGYFLQPVRASGATGMAHPVVNNVLAESLVPLNLIESLEVMGTKNNLGINIPAA